MAVRKILLSNLLQRVRVSAEKFAIGPRDDTPEVKYVPESEYNELAERSEREKGEAYRNGHSEGHRIGLAEGQEESRKTSAEFSRLIADVQSRSDEIYRRAELELLELALAIAHKVITVHAEMKPEILIDSVRKAVKLLLDRSNLVVKVAPDQERFIRDNLEKLYEIDDRIQRIEIETDRRIEPGGCILETESGNVDARIETELRYIAEAVRKANLNRSEH